ncbi:MAG: hypothetical protein ACXAAH_11470, partial [Promethearchaeota archaeon]|jgi:hypothetical protein
MNKEDEIIGKITQGKISIKQARKLLKQYAQQRERETAVDFELRHLLKTDAARRITYKYFDDWYTSHQNQEKYGS